VAARKAAPSRKTKARPDSVLDVIGVQRRAPFGENPAVGARGTRTQQRILRAALEVFGEVGYEACRVERITEVAGCSRPSFYQYFSSKEDLFRQLAGEVARALFAVIDGMGQVTPDEDGWQALRDWLGAYADLYERYWPVFAAFAAAEGVDDEVAAGAARVGDREIASLSAKIDPAAFRSGTPAVVAGLLLNAVNRANRYERLLARIAPGAEPERKRMLDSLADVLHRSLFGRRGVAMVEHRPPSSVRGLEPADDGPEPEPEAPRHGPAGRRTRTAILDAGARVFAGRGYHETRVDDIVAAAGVSHGTFYRYFANKDDAFRVVAGRSGGRVFRSISRIPSVAGDPGAAASTRALKKWVGEYAETWQAEGPIFRLWVEAMSGDVALTDVTVGSMDVIRGTLARFLGPRTFGDADMDAFLLLAFLDLSDEGPAASPAFAYPVDVVVALIRRGFLGLDARF
jgi:AcrR family transcriptional regulator